MNSSELKKKVSESLESEWFQKVTATFNFQYINYIQEFEGITAINEFVNQQITGWEKYEGLPNELAQSYNYFKNISASIDQFINAYSQQTSNRGHYWQQLVLNKINTISQKPLPYNIPQTEFLVKIHKDTPSYFMGAFNALVNNTVNQNDKNSLFGAILVYEFSLKDFSSLAERRNSEKRSILSLRTDFEKYLNESEKVLSSHLSKANQLYEDYANKIDELKNEKNDSYNEWFNKISNLEWDIWLKEKKDILEKLEDTYETKLKLEKPARYWEKKSTNYYKQAKIAKNTLIGVIVFSILFLSLILITAPNWIFTNVFKGNEVNIVRWSLIFITLISLIAFTIKSISKYMFSSYHLARDAEERHTLTFFYLALLKDSQVKDEERQMILQSLFSRTDTGLLKEDSSPTLPMTEIINRAGNR